MSNQPCPDGETYDCEFCWENILSHSMEELRECMTALGEADGMLPEEVEFMIDSQLHLIMGTNISSS